MIDALAPAAALVNKLDAASTALTIETEEPDGLSVEVRPADVVTADRMELRQIAGLTAGGRFELRPGRYEFGPTASGSGTLDAGHPDEVGFVLVVDDNLEVSIAPGAGSVRLEGRVVAAPRPVGDGVIDAGSARFVVRRPRPPRRRRRTSVDSAEPGWVDQPIPGPPPWSSRPADSVAVDLVADAEKSDLVRRRRRAHPGPDELIHRIESGFGLWGRSGDQPLFGKGLVAFVEFAESTVPVSVDLLASPTVVTGPRRYQLAVVRQLVVALAATCGPDSVELAVSSDDAGLAPLADLPHTACPGAARRLTIVDGTASDCSGRERSNSVLILADPESPTLEGADLVRIIDESSLDVIDGSGGPELIGATPVGLARSLTSELVTKLRQHHEAR